MTASAAGEFSRETAGSFTIGYEVVESTVRGHYSAAGHRFIETFDFSAVRASRPVDQRLARLLALAASLSYYKAIPTTAITIDFPVTESERHFLATIIRFGLAEFAYTNDLAEKLHPTITATIVSPDGTDNGWTVTERPLVAVGGGKDSVVSVEALVEHGWNPIAFSVNRHESIDRCVAVRHLDYLSVTRTLDRRLLDLNATGAPNGHVPVTAINSIVALITADLAGFGSVVMSNERSANVGNVEWDGIDVNHQWSKGLDFENLLRATLASDGLNPDRYFSLLRPLRELEIAKRFAHSPEYFEAFTSCNRAFRMDPGRRSASWCGECPKCLFVFLILAPYVSRDRLISIFGDDLLDDPRHEPLYEEILGLERFKPFECVGEIDEAAEALRLLAEMPDWSGDSNVVALLPRIGQHAPAAPASAQQHNIPDEFEAVTRDLLNS